MEVQVQDDGHSGQDGGSQDGKEWTDQSYILEVEQVEPGGGLNVGHNRWLWCHLMRWAKEEQRTEHFNFGMDVRDIHN